MAENNIKIKVEGESAQKIIALLNKFEEKEKASKRELAEFGKGIWKDVFSTAGLPEDHAYTVDTAHADIGLIVFTKTGVKLKPTADVNGDSIEGSGEQTAEGAANAA